MNFKSFIIWAVVLWSTIANAAVSPAFFSIVQCPAVGEEFSSMLAKLDAVKASVREGANCSDVTLRVKSLEDLVINDRKKITDIIEAGRKQPLSLEQTDELRQYSEEVTKKVAALYDLFTDNNKCFKDDGKENRMENLAGLVGDVSRLIGSVSGPWGTPIALAGNVVAGFLTGMDKVIKTRAGYDFSKREAWSNYIQNLCTFHGYRDQIEHLVDPQSRIAQLNSIKSMLDSNVSRMQADNTYSSYSVGIRSWLNREIQRVERESNTFWSDISGRHLLSQVRQDLHHFLIEREGPRFIAHQTETTAAQLKDMHFNSESEGFELYKQLYRLNPKSVSPKMSYYFPAFMEFFRALVVQPIQWQLLPDNGISEDLEFAWKAYRDQNVNRFRATEASLHVVQGFCQFFRQAGYYNSQIRAQCTTAPVRRMATDIARIGQELTKAKVLGGTSIRPQIFDPSSKSERGPVSQLDSLKLLVERLAAPRQP